MANGLRKLIKRAQKDVARTATLNRRFNRFGRLRAEELEERIAPAAVPLVAGEWTAWDAQGTDAMSADDGWFGITDGSTGGVTYRIADVTDAVGADTATLDITVQADAGAGVTRNVFIATNARIDSLDLTGLDTSITTLNIVIATGFDGAAVGQTITVGNVDGHGIGNVTAYVSPDTLAYVNTNFNTLADQSVGNILLPAIDGLDVSIKVMAGSSDATKGNVGDTVGNITSTTTVNLVGAGLTGGTDVYGTVIGNLALAGASTIAGGANGVDFTSTTGNIGNITAGAVTAAAGGSVSFDSAAAIGSVTLGGVTIEGAGNVALAGTTSIGATTLGGVTISGTAAGAFAMDGGTTGFTGAINTGDITVSTTGASAGVAITTTGAGVMGGVTTGAINFTGSNAATSIAIAPAGAGAMGGFTATGLISTGAASVGGITVGSANVGSATGNVSLRGVTLAGGGNVTVQGGSLGTITNQTNDMAVSAGATGDIVFNATGAAAAGSIGNITFTGTSITPNQGGQAVTFNANGDIGAFTMTDGDIAGAGAFNLLAGGAIGDFTVTDGFVGGAGPVNVTAGDALGDISVLGAGGAGVIGNGAGAVAFAGDGIGNIAADYIGKGGGVVGFDASGSGTGTIGDIDVTFDVASVGGSHVTFTADDGIGAVAIGRYAAQAANLNFFANADGDDDAGGMSTITAGRLGNAATGAGLVTINTNGGATDNTTQRGLTSITVTDGNARLALIVDGDIGDTSGAYADWAPAITVSGTYGLGGLGNLLDIVNLNQNAAGDPSYASSFTGIMVADAAGRDDILDILANDWHIPGRMGPITVGGSDSADLIDMNGNSIFVYNGQAPSAAFAAGYVQTLASTINITTGNLVDGVGGSVIQANVKAASDLLAVTTEDGLFRVAAGAGASAQVVFDPDNVNGNFEVTIDELAGTTASDDILVVAPAGEQFDVGGIFLAGVGNMPFRNIRIMGDLYGDIGTMANRFGNGNMLLIDGEIDPVGGATLNFFGAGLAGYAHGGGDLNVDAIATLLTLDPDTDDPLVLTAIAGGPGVIFRYADSDGVAADTFNNHIAVGAPAAGTGTVTIYGIRDTGAGVAAPADYLLEGSGVSDGNQPIDPMGLYLDADLFPGGAPAAGIYHVVLDAVGGLSTNVAVREVSGTLAGSWLEFESHVGLVNLSSNIESISVGISDGGDAVDNPITTFNAATAATAAAARTNFDRLGGGLAGGAKIGLFDPIAGAPINSPGALEITEANAVLGNLIVESIDDPGAANINIVVTGNSGPITLTAQPNLAVPTHGDFVTNDNNNAAAIAIGGDLVGDLTIPGQLSRVGGTFGADILIGIGLDLNGDGDVADAGEYGGSLLGNVLIGDAEDTRIYVADDITGDIVVTGVNYDPQDPGLDFFGNLLGIVAGGDIGDGAPGDDVVLIAGDAQLIKAAGALNSGIFVGGGGAGSAVVIEGTGINGPGVLGGAYGFNTVTFINHETFGDAGDANQIAVTNGVMTVEWLSGEVNDNEVGDIFLWGAGNVTNFAVNNINGAALDVGNIFVIENQGVNPLAFNSAGSLGVIVNADNVNIPSSAALLDSISAAAAHNAVIYGPTPFDTANADEGIDFDLDVTIQAVNAGGIVVSGNLTTVGVGIEVAGSMGYIVSLNGAIDTSGGAWVKAGTAIGHIVASHDIDGTFISEGTLAVGNADGLHADLAAFGLTGVPAWFNGGILAEVGNIGANADETPTLGTGPYALFLNGTIALDVNADGILNPAQGDVQGTNNAVFTAAGGAVMVNGTVGWYEDAMGTFYAPAGSMSADINVAGSFGGIQVPAGVVQVELTVPMEATIDRLIAPQYTDNRDGNAVNSSAATSRPDADIEAISGESLVFPGRTYRSGAITVTLTGANTIAIVSNNPATAEIDNIILVDGLPAGAALTVVGDVTDIWVRDYDGTNAIAATGTLQVTGEIAEMLIDGGWLGSVIVMPGTVTDGDGTVGVVRVNGNIDAAAGLTAQNYGQIVASQAALANVTVRGTLDINQSVSWINMAGDDQTLYVGGGGIITTSYTRIFDKLVDVQLSGLGFANVITVNADLDASNLQERLQLNTIANNVRIGRGDPNLSGTGAYAVAGTAHADSISIRGGSTINLGSVVVDGDVIDLQADRMLASMWIGGNAGSVNVGGAGFLNQAFIGGNAGTVSAQRVMGLRVGGNVGTLTAGMLFNSTIQGATGNLIVNHHVVNNTFGLGVGVQQIGGVAVMNSGLV